jgi:hypothetical protein
MLTWLLETDNICDICHVDTTLQLKTRFALCGKAGLIFTHHKLGLLFVGVDILAAQKNTLKKENMILEEMLAMNESEPPRGNQCNHKPRARYPCHYRL